MSYKNSGDNIEEESLSEKVREKMKSDKALKNKIKYAQEKLQSQISKLEKINDKLQTS